MKWGKVGKVGKVVMVVKVFMVAKAVMVAMEAMEVVMDMGMKKKQILQMTRFGQQRHWH